jgi:hypothetical protein
LNRIFFFLLFSINDEDVIKIIDKKIFYDFQLNTIESVIVGRHREEVLEKIQRGFENQYNPHDKLKLKDIQALLKMIKRK